MSDLISIPVAKRGTERGAALIVTLSFVVLLSVLVIVFLARSATQRKAETAGAGAQQAELLARDAVRIILGDLQKEVEAGSESFATHGFYLPRASETMVPSRTVMPAVSAAAVPTFHQLLKQSGAERFFPAASSYAATPEPLLAAATTLSTLEPALSGRWISLERWNAPRLLTGAGFASADQVPRWVYIDRDLGPVAAPTATADLTGRIAFNLYDVGGLIDLNVAGAASTLLSTRVVGTAGGVEPRWLGNASLVDTLLEWRNPATGGSEANYVDYLQRVGPMQAFQETPAGDRRLMSRRDLILALTTRFNGLDGMLPYVGHYSRELAAPGMRAGAVTLVNPHPVGVQRPGASTITTYRLDGSPVTYTVEEGSPVMPFRFSLNRLQWLTHAGPLDPGLEPAIRACFGLVWNPTDQRWDYLGSDGGVTVQGSILTLAQVAALGREPNFFEVLKAAIDTGSLGQAATSVTMNPTQASYDAERDLQLIRIGANIIDNGDADNYPTRIAFATGGTVHPVSGVEDLPYLWGAFPISLVAYESGTSSSPPKIPRFRSDLVLTPHLFNPHQAGSSVPTAGPTNLRLRLEGELRRVQWRADTTAAGAGGDVYHNYTGTMALSVKTPVEVPITAASFRAVPDIPTAPTGSTAAGRYSAQLPHFSDTGMGFVLLSVVHDPPEEPVGTSTSPANVWAEGLNVILEYQKNGAWVPYDRLTGVEGLPGAVAKPAASTFNLTNVGSRVVAATGPGVFTQSFNNGNLTRSYLPKLDPRTTRLSLSWNPSASYGGGANGPANQMPAATVRFQSNPPFVGWENTQLIQLPQAGLAVGANPGQVADPDGVVRPADGYRGATGNPLQSGAQPTSRPVMLQRPYQSVGELGYVFRDQPWKTLDLSSPRSADGALLEFFCVGESVPERAGGGVMNPPLMAGKVNLNTASDTVLTAVLANAMREADTLATRLSDGEAAAAAAVLANPTLTPRAISMAALNAWSNTGAAELSPEHQAAKRAGEQVARALAGAGQVRTWNLMLDVVAQAGKFPPARYGGGLEHFAVDGEARFWVFIAIDRLTGEVLDVRYEAPYE